MKLNPNKTPAGFVVDINKLIVKSLGLGQGTSIAKTNLKKNKTEGLILSNFKTDSKARM